MTDGVSILVPASPERFDGVRDFARQLADALAPARRVELVTTSADAAPPGGARVIPRWAGFDVPRGTRAIIVNYLPPAWLRRDTIGLMRSLRRFRGAGGTVIVVVHEYQIDRDGSLRRGAARAAFRSLARAFARRATVLVATHQLVVRRLAVDGLDRLARVAIIPIGSAMPLGSAPPHGDGSVSDRVVVFGQPAFMDVAAVTSVINALEAAGRSRLHWICRNAEELRRWLAAAGIDETSVVIRGGLDARDVSNELHASVVAFAPIADGVSTRRSTIAAFLQHGLPVVGITGPATDDVLEHSGAFALTPRDDARGLTAHLMRLLSSPGDRAEMSAAGRAFFDDQLAWPRIARKYLELMA